MFFLGQTQALRGRTRVAEGGAALGSKHPPSLVLFQLWVTTYAIFWFCFYFSISAQT